MVVRELLQGSGEGRERPPARDEDRTPAPRHRSSDGFDIPVERVYNINNIPIYYKIDDYLYLHSRQRV